MVLVLVLILVLVLALPVLTTSLVSAMQSYCLSENCYYYYYYY